jgi:tetratricopeptide (TPR) repeat protein
MGRLQLARAYFEEGKFSDLEPLLKDLCSFEETSVEATLLWANMQRRLGHFVAAKTQFMSVAQALPDRDDAILGAVYSGKLLSSEGQLLNQLKQALAAASYGSGRAKSLHFALGKAFDDLGEYEAAISHFDAGHKIALMEMKSAGASFRPETYAAEVDSYIQLFGPELAERPAPIGSASERPIFIVGFPRSGTTLVEQILSSHPDVAAGGEIHFWPQASACLFANEIVGGRLEAAGCLVERYMGILSGISAHSRRVTDKQPDNYRHLGLIHWLFPNARIIHCRRHPLDTCLSIYMTAFQNSIDYSHDRGHLAFAYRNYRKLMDHWRSMVPPPRLFELNYERLASNKEQPIRDLVEFCGLDWSDACLLPHENPGAVATPSMWQVRQPIYQTSVDRWRNYSPWLGELNSLADYF